MQKSDDLKVFISRRESKCVTGSRGLGALAWIFLQDEKGALVCSLQDEIIINGCGE